MVSRYAVCGVSPLTGYWGEATSGGNFPFRLKGSGFDGIIITGRSEKPVYLYLKDGQAEIRDASHLWGKDSYETQKLIKDELGDANISVACIAAGGEKQIRYACIMNDKGRSAGRCGMGALMGSKNLKAVAAVGNSKPQVADAGKVRALAKQAVTEINGNMISVAFREYGTLMYMDMGMMLGDVPAKYFTKSVFPVEKLTGEAFRQEVHDQELRLPRLSHRLRPPPEELQARSGRGRAGIRDRGCLRPPVPEHRPGFHRRGEPSLQRPRLGHHLDRGLHRLRHLPLRAWRLDQGPGRPGAQVGGRPRPS